MIYLVLNETFSVICFSDLEKCEYTLTVFYCSNQICLVIATKLIVFLQMKLCSLRKT